VRGLRLLSAVMGRAAPNPQAIQALEGPVRRSLAGVRGEFALLALDWSLLSSGDGEAAEAAPGFSYVLEGSEKLRVVLAPGAEPRLERRGGLIYLNTPPLEGGSVRLVAVTKHRLTTWLRPIHAGAVDGPKTKAETR
jgi:hypothetical protein